MDTDTRCSDVLYGGCHHVCPTCSGAGQRRVFSPAEKVTIVEEAIAEGNLSATARKYGVAPRLLFAWQSRYMDGHTSMMEERVYSWRGRRVIVKPSPRRIACDECTKIIHRGQLGAFVQIRTGARDFHYECLKDKLQPLKHAQSPAPSTESS